MEKIKLYPVWKEVEVDLETPVSAFLKLRDRGARILLESVEKGEKLGRYSFIGLEPSEVLRIQENQLIIGEKSIPFFHSGIIPELRNKLFSYEIEILPELPPFIGGWIGFLGYDLVRYFEELPSRLSKNNDWPQGLLYLIKDLLVFDHLKHRAKVISLVESGHDKSKTDKKIDDIIRALDGPLVQNKGQKNGGLDRPPVSNFNQDEFEHAVRDAKDYIYSGDVFQVVISQQYSGETSASAFDIYRKLRMINPSPYMFFLDFEDFQLAGSSPEALVTLNHGKATLHPIAGTRPRGDNPKEDEQLAYELFKSEKERAEHVMLVDLARNDLGRVCLPHTVKVKQKMQLEKYSHVMHLVSEVEGTLNPDLDALDLLRAVYPAGTVTGAPKIRAMEIIEELEKKRRALYAGAVGYIGLDGNMDMCIAIRMIIRQKQHYYLQAGAGIVADSEPAFEYQETLNKMQGLYQAVKMAGGKENDLAYRQL